MPSQEDIQQPESETEPDVASVALSLNVDEPRSETRSFEIDFEETSKSQKPQQQEETPKTVLSPIEEVQNEERTTEEAGDIEAEEEEEKDEEKVLQNTKDEDFDEFLHSDEKSVGSEEFDLLEVETETEEPSPEEVQEKKKKKRKKAHPIPDNISHHSEYSGLRVFDADTANISGDFGSSPSHKVSKLPSTHSETSEPIEEEEEQVEEEEKEEGLTEYERILLYQKYDSLKKQYQAEKVKSSYLGKHLANYYKKKKMYHVLHEGKLKSDTLKKYEKQLDDFEDLTKARKEELRELQAEITDLRINCTFEENEARTCFEKLQQVEHELGKELISEAGKGNEFVERYLKRQKIQLSNMMKIRMDYIKIRNKVSSTQNALDGIDNLGPNLRLIDYEQLKVDNRNLHDKLEEKDLELGRVRLKCQHAVQILAHRREKVAALDADIQYLRERLDTATGEYEDAREQLNRKKQARDFFRNAIDRLKEASGLLSKPRLLRDMCLTIAGEENLTRQVQEVKNEYKETSNKVRNIRNNMAQPKRMAKIMRTTASSKANITSDTITDKGSEASVDIIYGSSSGDGYHASADLNFVNI